jgi:hypothetical protein
MSTGTQVVVCDSKSLHFGRVGTVEEINSAYVVVRFNDRQKPLTLYVDQVQEHIR